MTEHEPGVVFTTHSQFTNTQSTNFRIHINSYNFVKTRSRNLHTYYGNKQPSPSLKPTSRPDATPFFDTIHIPVGDQIYCQYSLRTEDSTAILFICHWSNLKGLNSTLNCVVTKSDHVPIEPKIHWVSTQTVQTHGNDTVVWRPELWTVKIRRMKQFDQIVGISVYGRIINHRSRHWLCPTGDKLVTVPRKYQT